MNLLPIRLMQNPLMNMANRECGAPLNLRCVNDTLDGVGKVAAVIGAEACSFPGAQGIDKYLRGEMLTVIGVAGECTMAQNSHDVGREYWATPL